MNIDLGKMKKGAAEVAKKHDLKLLLLFGSQVTGRTHKFSDYDFGFLADVEFDYKKRSALCDDLMRLAGDKNVEDVDLTKSGPLLLREIVNNNIVLYEKDFEYENFFSYAVRTYISEKRIFDLNKILYENTILKYKQKIYGQ